MTAYGLVTLTRDEKILLECTADIPKKFRNMRKEATYGFGIDATEFFLDYYDNLIKKKEKELGKLKEKRERWAHQCLCEVYPD